MYHEVGAVYRAAPLFVITKYRDFGIKCVTLHKYPEMKKLSYIFFLLTFCALEVWAENPNNHMMLLQDNEKDKKAEIPSDEENPYFLLSGEVDKALAEGDYATAVLRIRDALAVDPTNPGNPMLMSNLAAAYKMLGQDSLALATYDHALAMAPAMTTIRNNRALLLLQMGKDKEAFGEFSQVIDQDSLNDKARYYRGIMLLYAGILGDAEKDIQVYASKNKDEYADSALGMLYAMTGREKQAIPYLLEVVKTDPSPEFYSMLAGCYLQLQEYSSAGAILAEAMEKCGEDAELYYYRAWLKRDTFQLDQAKADAKQAIALGADPRRVNQLFQR